MMNQHRGFGLIEVLMAMVLVSLAALMSMSVLKSVGAKQIEASQYAQYVLASEGIKDRFNQYLYESPASIASTINCNGSPSFDSYLCTAETQLNRSENITTGLGYKITVNVNRGVIKPCYYNNVINIMDLRVSTSVPVFSRLFVTSPLASC